MLLEMTFWRHKTHNLIEELAMQALENEGEEHEDHHDDWTETAPYCGKKLHALYESDWFVGGDIEYYNKNICKYHVWFHNGSEDYIGENNIDMIITVCSKICVLKIVTLTVNIFQIND